MCVSGLGKWVDLVREANYTQTPLPAGYTGPPIMQKTISLAMARGCFRFLLYVTIGTILSRIACELLLSAYILRDALYHKLGAPSPSPLVKPAAEDAAGGGGGGGGYELNPGRVLGAGSGYQTVA